MTEVLLGRPLLKVIIGMDFDVLVTYLFNKGGEVDVEMADGINIENPKLDAATAYRESSTTRRRMTRFTR